MILLIYTIFTVIVGSGGDYLSPEAATLKKKVIKGIRKQTGKFKNLKGIESNAKSPIPWEV